MDSLQMLFNQAVQLHRGGRIHEAIALYTRLLPQQPENAGLLFLLGTAHLQVGEHSVGVGQLRHSIALDSSNPLAHNNLGNALKDLKRMVEALESYDRALALKPDHAGAHFSRGTVLMALKRPVEALASFDRTLALAPNNPIAHFNRGNALIRLKRPEEALVSYDRALALKPDHAKAWINRGNVLNDLNRATEALASIDQALSLTPDHAWAHFSRGAVLMALKRDGEALASFDRAIALQPDHAGASNLRGTALRHLGRQEEALASCDRAIALDPAQADAHNNRGSALYALNRLEEALASFDQMIALQPDYAEAHYNRGNALNDLKQLDAALESYRSAIAIRPGYADAHNNLGNVFNQLKQPEEALASFNAAIALKPGDARQYWNKALLLILMGRYLEGWALYEWRLKKEDVQQNYPAFPKPVWRGGQDMRGKRLLIHSEQGLGDAIQFCRYLPLIQQSGAEIIFEVLEPLMTVMSSLSCPTTLVVKGDLLPAFDAYCPLMSLPYAFKTTLETVPADTPYLFSDARKRAAWQRTLGDKKALRVGLVWSGSVIQKNIANRSIRLQSLLSNLLATHALPVEWHSLQKEYRQEDLAVLTAHPDIVQHQDDLHDFSDTAALIDCMDLVISVDTSVAHLAGAMGKAVWILLPFAADYRWMLDRADSPWYPSARLYRQAAPGDWKGALAKIRSDLIDEFGG